MNCKICGKEIAKSMYSNAVLCSSKCFNTNYWQEIMAEKEKYIIINGECYHDGGNIEHPNSYSFLGHGGRRFWIRFKDGKTLTTNNLWAQGPIPEEYKSELPDTAEFYIPKEVLAKNEKYHVV